jgi:hypothetical protein
MHSRYILFRKRSNYGLLQVAQPATLLHGVERSNTEASSYTRIFIKETAKWKTGLLNCKPSRQSKSLHSFLNSFFDHHIKHYISVDVLLWLTMYIYTCIWTNALHHFYSFRTKWLLYVPLHYINKCPLDFEIFSTVHIFNIVSFINQQYAHQYNTSLKRQCFDF